MSEFYPCRFKADEENQSRAGIASFWVEGVNSVIPLESFKDCQIISKMLKLANDAGVKFGAQPVCDTAVNRAKERASQLVNR